MNKVKNTKKDLIWIIPYMIGQLFMIIYIPIRLLFEINNVGILSINTLVYMSIIILLITKIELSSLYELFEVFDKR